MSTIRTGSQEASAVRAPTTADAEGHVLDTKAVHERVLQEERPRGLVPVCLTCGSDDALVHSTFSEQVVLPNGRIRHARARYCCARCGRSRDHEVPASWRPPGWFWCT